MRIKRFTAATLGEATDQMRRELGPDAIILNTRTVPRSNAMGIFGRELFELTAAIDDNVVVPSSPRGGRALGFDRYLNSSVERESGTIAVNELRKMAERFDGKRCESVQDHRETPRQAVEMAGMLDLRNEMESMRGALREISDHLKYQKLPGVPQQLREAYSTLIANDVDEEIACQIVQAVNASLGPDQRADKRLVEEMVIRAIASLIHMPEKGKVRRRKTRVIALVGPTGVGKTTTIAKLAAIFKLVQRKNVGLLSADTYRIGAIEQLKAFAAIADIPIDVMYRPAEIPAALRRFKDKDLVLLDTVGRGHRSKKEITELARYLDAADPDETHLVLSATTNVKTVMEIVGRFKATKPNRLLFTKLDEATSLGPLLTVMHRNKLPIGYITTGQTVPDDIMTVDPTRLASMVYSGEDIHA